MTLNQAIETARVKAASSPRWLRAIDRAAAGLQSNVICVTLFADNAALVTTPNNSHVVNGACDCAAAQHGHKECVHRAAKRLIEMLEVAEPVATKAATKDDIIRDIHARWPKSWPPLAVELMARFRKNQLEMLADDMLRGVLAAIA
jgi:hypothetical protein